MLGPWFWVVAGGGAALLYAGFVLPAALRPELEPLPD